MKNKYLFIGAGVLIAGYLLYNKGQKDKLNIRVENLTKLVNDSAKNTIEVQANNNVQPQQNDYKIIYDTENCNNLTQKCLIIGATVGAFKFDKKGDKYYKQQVYPTTSIPMEITEKQWVEECIIKLPI